MIKIIFLNLKTTFFRLYEWTRVARRFYTHDLRFVGIDLLFLTHYLLKNPHVISRDFLRKKGESNIYGFGETPLTTLDKIVKECRILSKDFIFELGCGSGRTCFWLKTFVKCRVVGVDYLPTFIKKAKQIKSWSGLTGIDFLEEDMLAVDLERATAIYLYGTCLEDEIIEKLITRFRKLRTSTKIITVSYPLTDYNDKDFKLSKQFTARFPWGTADVFLNEKI